MTILVGCEMSGRVRDAFIKKGHDARSCDLLQTLTKGPHYRRDLLPLLNYSWDMIIAFPPCTHLCSSGARHWASKKDKQKAAIDFVMAIANAPCPKICIENPVGILSTVWRKPDQIIDPFQFGHEEMKTTCLWLKGLPKLKPTKIMNVRKQSLWRLPQNKDRSILRSLTFQGIADAMAEQWG